MTKKSSDSRGGQYVMVGQPHQKQNVLQDPALNLEYKKYSVLTNVQTTMKDLKKQIAPENYLSPDYRHRLERR